MFINPFHRSSPVDTVRPETVPESDFEEITSAELENVNTTKLQNDILLLQYQYVTLGLT